VENESHPVNEWFRKEEAFDNYALNIKLTKAFFLRALEACATLDVDLNMVEKARREEHPPWIGDNMANIIPRMNRNHRRGGITKVHESVHWRICNGRMGRVFGNMRSRRN
jgi:hypothetical protein